MSNVKKTTCSKRRVLIGSLGTAMVGAWVFAASSLAAPPGPLKFGAYDPDGDFSSDTGVNIEHLFLPWVDVDIESLPLADAYTQQRNRSVLVTIEPWTWSRDERNTASFLQSGIAAGEYDENMRQVCAVLAKFKSKVTVRWGHEMDDLSGQFIWAGWNPDAYISAYRRMIGICKQSAPNVTYMWSPLGYETLEKYYPGDDFVDVVGLSVFGLQAWEQKTQGKALSFKEILAPRYNRAIKFGKPIIVAELGYVGDAAYVQDWENSVRQKHAEFPALTSVVYFNQKEVYPWPDNMGLPDWRIGSRVLN